MSKARSTIHTITKQQFEDLAEKASWRGVAFRDESGVMWYTSVSVAGYPVNVIHNATDDRYLVTIARGPGAHKARRELGVA